MRVLIVSPDPISASGGGSLIAQELGQALPFETLHVRPSRDDHAALAGERLFGRTLLASYLPPSRGYVARIGRILDEFTPDVLHAHGFGHPVIHAAIRLARARDLPIVLTVHGVSKAEHLPWPFRASLSWYHCQASVVLEMVHTLTCPSANVAADLRRYTSRVPVVTPWGVQVPSRVQPRSDAIFPKLITVGRLAPLRHVETLIDAMVIIRREWPDATLDVIGPDASRRYGARLRSLVETRRLAGVVRLLGPLPRQRSLGIVSQASVYVSAAVQETYGLALLEAALLGVPCVVTDRGIAPEIIEAPSGRLVAAYGTPSEFASAVQTVLGNYHLAAHDAILRSQELAARFDWAKTVSRYAELLSDAAADRI